MFLSEQDKQFFKIYKSNTFAGTNNNSMLSADKKTTVTGRIYYKVREYGKLNYRLFFSNIVDSTFGNNCPLSCNTKGDSYEITEAYIGDGGLNVDPNEAVLLQQLHFDGKKSKNVESGEVFWSDDISLNIAENHYLVFQWTVKYTKVAYTPDKIIESFILNDNGEFISSVDFPQPQFIGCTRSAKTRLTFLGDSITMGLGTSNNLYNFWVAKIGAALGNDYAVWNIGLGFGKAADAATKGIWLEKAKNSDIVSICFGVNDIGMGRSAEQIISDLKTIISELKACGCKISVFTVPTFDWEGENQKTWDAVNDAIRNDISKTTDYWFDMAEVTSCGEDNKYVSKYCGHPNDEGCADIAEKFLEKYNLL